MRLPLRTIVLLLLPLLLTQLTACEKPREVSSKDAAASNNTKHHNQVEQVQTAKDSQLEQSNQAGLEKVPTKNTADSVSKPLDLSLPEAILQPETGAEDFSERPNLFTPVERKKSKVKLSGKVYTLDDQEELLESIDGAEIGVEVQTR